MHFRWPERVGHSNPRTSHTADYSPPGSITSRPSEFLPRCPDVRRHLPNQRVEARRGQQNGCRVSCSRLILSRLKATPTYCCPSEHSKAGQPTPESEESLLVRIF